MRIVRTRAAVAALFALAACQEQGEAPRSFGTVISVAGHFGEGGEPSEDVSGMACDWQAGDTAMRCLVVEDEGDEAQWARLSNGVLYAERRFGLDAAGIPLGVPVRGICAREDSESREFDGEAVAFSEGAFYVTGSHGCSRSSDELRPASFVVVRIVPDDPGVDVLPGAAAIDRSFRLAELLQREPALSAAFGASLEEADGLNVEGLAVDGQRMVFGLRAPAAGGTAYLFETSIAALFARDIAGTGRSVPVVLGPGAGIRDLAFLPGGRLLILSGPAQDQDVPYRVHLLEADGSVRMLETVTPPYGGKAEAIAVTGIEGSRVSLLVLFDGVADGAPQMLTLDFGG